MAGSRTPLVNAGEGVSHQASLLVSILVRYPEIGSVRFIASDGQISFTFMTHGVYNRTRLAEFRQVMLSHLEAYNLVTGHTIGYIGVTGVVHGEYTQVQIVRDVATVSREELSLLIGLIRAHFGQDLVIENDEPLHDDERLMQEDLIDDILEEVKVGGLQRELVGFREAGRVMVFNKNPGPSQEHGSGVVP